MSISEKLKNNLSSMFDFFEDYEHNGTKFDLYGRYYKRSSKYVAVKKAEIYAFTNFEHLFYIKLNELNQSNFDDLSKSLTNNIEQLVKPNEEHMSSTLTLIIECFNLDKNMEKIIKNYKFQKSFKLGLNGWVKSKIIVLIQSENKYIENKLARGDTKKLQLLI